MDVNAKKTHCMLFFKRGEFIDLELNNLILSSYIPDYSSQM